jgi:hypothetical protein
MTASTAHSVARIAATAPVNQGRDVLLDFELDNGRSLALALPHRLCAVLIHVILAGAGAAALLRGEDPTPRPGDTIRTLPIDVETINSGIAQAEDGTLRLVLQLAPADGIPLDFVLAPAFARQWAEAMLRDLETVELARHVSH